jgi:hypothetical protein
MWFELNLGNSFKNKKGANQVVRTKEIEVKKERQERINSDIEDPYEEFEMAFDEPDCFEKPSGSKRQMLMEIPEMPILDTKKLAKPLKITRNRFGIDESLLKKAEEESELLDSLCEMSERQLHTHKEEGMTQQNEGLLGRLLEDDYVMKNYGLGSI